MGVLRVSASRPLKFVATRLAAIRGSDHPAARTEPPSLMPPRQPQCRRSRSVRPTEARAPPCDSRFRLGTDFINAPSNRSGGIYALKTASGATNTSLPMRRIGGPAAAHAAPEPTPPQPLRNGVEAVVERQERGLAKGNNDRLVLDRQHRGLRLLRPRR
jgi:hypothetical protein